MSHEGLVITINRVIINYLLIKHVPHKYASSRASRNFWETFLSKVIITKWHRHSETWSRRLPSNIGYCPHSIHQGVSVLVIFSALYFGEKKPICIWCQTFSKYTNVRKKIILATYFTKHVVQIKSTLNWIEMYGLDEVEYVWPCK